MMHDHEPVDYQGFRITSLWAFTVIGSDDEEGIIACNNGGTMMPLIASDRVRLDDYRELAQTTADLINVEVRLRKFVFAEDLEIIKPQAMEQ